MSAFPLQLLGLLRCTHDGGALEASPDLGGQGARVENGVVTCKQCAAQFSISGGILDLVGGRPLEGESGREQALRDITARAPEEPGNSAEADHERMEVIPTLRALDLRASDVLLELGCGNGRYTTRLAGQCRSLVAVDFSVESLRALAAKLGDAPTVALVLGDVTTLRVASHAFDRVFCTLTSNLPTREAREALYALAAKAITRDGHFVYSSHHHGVRARRRGDPKSGLYHAGGIYRYNFTLGEARREARRHFADVDAHPIRIYVPFGRFLPGGLVEQSRLAQRVPGVNRFGSLVLVRTSHDTRRAWMRRLRRVGAALAVAFGATFALLQLDAD